MPRNQWQSQKADEVVVGKDGKLRGAKLVAVSKSETRTTYYRPVQKLIEFEIDYKVKETDDHVENECDEVNDDEVVADKVHKPDRSSYPEVFLVKVVLKICSKFTGEVALQLY